MDGLKYPRILQFDKVRNEKTFLTNLKELYFVSQAPCDSSLSDVLDPVNPEDLRPAFDSIHRQLQRQKVLEDYQYLGGYLVES